ncbi:hypothetical protein [Arthrobacter sp. HLT1-21]
MEVTVHSTWGLLDGLGWLPHDSFIFDVATGEVKDRSIEGKGEYLDVDEAGDWSIREAPTEWIWRSSMSLGQIRVVAEGAKRLAALAGRSILTMWFIDLLDDSGIECLPWMTHTNVPEIRNDALPKISNAVVVRTASDLKGIERAVTGGKSVILQLHPGSELVRDKNLIENVTQTALKYEIPVQIIGSPLGHPYYMLSAAGVHVTCRQITSESQKVYGKVVRDAIPDIIEQNGEVASYYKVAGKQREKLFRAKVLEEAMELFRARDQSQTIDEMADLEEILGELRKDLRISRKEIEERKREKRLNRGGFTQGLVLNRTSTGRAISFSEQPPLPGMEFYGDRSIAWQVRKVGGQVQLNYVPPLVGHRSIFTIDLDGIAIRVRYRESHIEVDKVSEVKDQPIDPLW